MIDGDSGTHPSSPNYDGRNEPEEYVNCECCGEKIKLSDAVNDFYHAVLIGKCCLQNSEDIDVRDSEPSKETEIRRYYENLKLQK